MNAWPDRAVIFIPHQIAFVLTPTSVGKLIIISAPSGGGKSTIVRHLLARFDELRFSVSATTRAPRAGEVHGKHYYFYSIAEFKKLIADGAFVEYEEVYPDQYYGTLHRELERIWAAGHHVIFDVEVKGATNLARMYPERTLAVFVRPPSVETLIARLKGRGTESAASLQKRIARFEEELSYERHFDTLLINDDLTETLKTADHLVRAFLTEQISPTLPAD